MKQIRKTLEQFSTFLENKDWESLKNILDDDLIIDYPMFKTTGKVTPDQYVSERNKRLENIKLYHILTPLKIGVSQDKALCKAYSIIYRIDRFKYFNSHVDYVFGLVREKDDWIIRSIRQSVIWNDGALKYI